MFADSLLEVSSAQRARKSWITAFSMAAQVVVAGCILLLPLLHPERLTIVRNLPAVSWVRMPQPVEGTFRPSANPRTGTISLFVRHALSFRPSGPSQDPSDPAAPCPTCLGPIVSTGPGSPFPVATSGPAMPLPVPAHVDHPLRISHFMGGNLDRQVQPQYPTIAKTAGIEGAVLLRAIVSREGTIEHLQVISGHPLLVRAAIEAVQQWHYRPYVLNGQAVEVETEITVNFQLNRAR